MFLTRLFKTMLLKNVYGLRVKHYEVSNVLVVYVAFINDEKIVSIVVKTSFSKQPLQNVLY